MTRTRSTSIEILINGVETVLVEEDFEDHLFLYYTKLLSKLVKLFWLSVCHGHFSTTL